MRIGRVFSYLSTLVGIEKIPASPKPAVTPKAVSRKAVGNQPRCRRAVARRESDRLSCNDLTQQAAAAAADQEKNVIQNKEDLPVFLRNLTAAGEEFSDIGESSRHKFALLDLGNKQCLVLALPSAMSSGVLGTTLARAKKAGYQIQKKCTVTFKVLDEINAEIAHKNGIKGEKREPSPEEQSRLLTLFVEIITNAVKKGASDIHIEIREQLDGSKKGEVKFRIDGKLYKVYSYDGETLLTMLSVAYISRITTSDSRSHTAFVDREPHSCTMEYTVGAIPTRFRYHDTPCKDGMDAVMRVLSDDKNSRVGLSLVDLGFEKSQRKLLAMAASMPEGAIVVAGVTGCGKSTTLKTLIAFLCKKNPQKKYYTIEDPAEFKLFGVTQISIPRAEKDKKNSAQTGKDVNPFALATERLMRLDPDVIMSGEVRDFHSGSATKQLVQTGHQVFTTVHAKNAFQIPARLASAEIGMARDTICAEGFIVAMIGQKLVPKLCPKCKVSAAMVLPPEKLADMEKKYGIDPSAIKCRSEKGCPACEGRGSNGRTVCAEVWIPTRKELVLLRTGKDDEAEYSYRAGRLTAYTDADMTGKTTFEHALYKISQGMLDPLDVEGVFGPFELLDTKIIKIKGEGEHEFPGNGKTISIVDDKENDQPRAN